MNVRRHALAILACAMTARIAAIGWEVSHPKPVSGYADLGIEQPDSSNFIYIWLGVFLLLCFLWFLIDLKIKHD